MYKISVVANLFLLHIYKIDIVLYYLSIFCAFNLKSYIIYIAYFKYIITHV